MTFILLLIPLFAYSQGDKKYIRQGNRDYDDGKYSDSEISYRKAFDKNNTSANAVFNIGNALYKQKKYEDAGKQFESNYEMNDEQIKKSASLYNLGNSFIMANKIPESIEAYKGSLKLNPDNEQAKYNLAYAQDLLKQQQQQQQQQKQNKDQNKENQDNKDQKQDQNSDKDQQNQNQQQQQQQQQQGEQQQISKEDAERILNALANDEKDVQEKVKLAKAKQEKIRTLRNW